MNAEKKFLKLTTNLIFALCVRKLLALSEKAKFINMNLKEDSSTANKSKEFAADLCKTFVEDYTPLSKINIGSVKKFI